MEGILALPMHYEEVKNKILHKRDSLRDRIESRVFFRWFFHFFESEQKRVVE